MRVDVANPVNGPVMASSLLTISSGIGIQAWSAKTHVMPWLRKNSLNCFFIQCSFRISTANCMSLGHNLRNGPSRSAKAFTLAKTFDLKGDRTEWLNQQLFNGTDSSPRRWLRRLEGQALFLTLYQSHSSNCGRHACFATNILMAGES